MQTNLLQYGVRSGSPMARVFDFFLFFVDKQYIFFLREMEADGSLNVCNNFPIYVHLFLLSVACFVQFATVCLTNNNKNGLKILT